MDATYENRTSERLKYKATVMIEIRDTAIFHYATTDNFSGDGLYCGSDFALKPGTFVTIKFENPPFTAAPKLYSGEVLRCEELEGYYNAHNYGLGIKINKAILS